MQGFATGWRARVTTLTAAGAVACAVVLAGSATQASAAVPAKTDVLFVFDTSGSMRGSLAEAKAEINSLIATTKSSLPDVQFGVANVEDVPGNEFGTPFTEKSPSEYEADTEKAWELWQPLTPETSKVTEAVENLSGFEVAHNGGDYPEAYGRALFETATNPRVKWRAGARHEIVLIADNVPHTPNVNEGIPPSVQLNEPGLDGVEWPNSGEELGGKFGIKETQWKTGESLEFHKVLARLDAEEKPLAMVDYFHKEQPENENYVHYWEYWAAATGGQAIQAEEGSNTLAARLAAIIKESAEGIPPCAPGYERTATTPCVKKPSPPPPPPPHATATSVICNLVIATASDTCTATVGDAASSGATPPTGTVTFASASGGVFSLGNACSLTALSGNASSCSVQFLPPSVSSPAPAITATYTGDSTHTTSSGKTGFIAAGLLASDITIPGSGSMNASDTAAQLPVTCLFPCIVTAQAYTEPGLAKLTAFTAKKKKKGKKKPVLVGSGTLRLSKPGKGTLVIRFTRQAQAAIRRHSGKTVHVTLKLVVQTLNGTLVKTGSQGASFKPPRKKKHH